MTAPYNQYINNAKNIVSSKMNISTQTLDTMISNNANFNNAYTAFENAYIGLSIINNNQGMINSEMQGLQSFLQMSNLFGLVTGNNDYNNAMYNVAQSVLLYKEYKETNPTGNDISGLAQDLFNDTFELVENQWKAKAPENSSLRYGNETGPYSTTILEELRWIIRGLGAFEPIGDIKKLWGTGKTTQPIVIDPLVIDLDGDGIETTTVANRTFFDHQNDGYAEQSAWVAPDDGILVHDKNNNGTIDNGNEIFGDNYTKLNNQKASSGFDALFDFDSNNDWVINANDTNFSNLKVLKGDGTLLTLQEAGITQINLSNTPVNTTDANGNTQLTTGV